MKINKVDYNMRYNTAYPIDNCKYDTVIVGTKAMHNGHIVTDIKLNTTQHFPYVDIYYNNNTVERIFNINKVYYIEEAKQAVVDETLDDA
jgi:flagellar biosynthesis/type III secretory pathway ATPase